MTEAQDAKAARLRAAGALTIAHVDQHRIAATCKGDSGTYQLKWDPRGGYSCSCPGHGYRSACAHERALRLVTDWA
jgi:hypothetical protein